MLVNNSLNITSGLEKIFQTSFLSLPGAWLLNEQCLWTPTLLINILWPESNGCYFADDIIKWLLLKIIFSCISYFGQSSFAMVYVIIAWCRHNYLNQCQPRLTAAYVVTSHNELRQHWFRLRLGAEPAICHYLDQWWLNSLKHTNHCAPYSFYIIACCYAICLKQI